MTENELKQIVVRDAKAHGWLVYHVPQRTMHNGGGKGYPDLTLAREPTWNRPGVFWIELKQEGGKLTEEQARWRSILDTEVIRPSDIASGRLGELLK